MTLIELSPFLNRSWIRGNRVLEFLCLRMPMRRDRMQLLTALNNQWQKRKRHQD